MAGPLVVVGEPRSLVAEGQGAAGERNETERRRFSPARLVLRLAVRRGERVQREQVLQVDQQPFLVLLFVVQPEQHDLPDLFGKLTFEEFGHPVVHLAPVVEHFGDGRPRQESPDAPALPAAAGAGNAEHLLVLRVR